MSQPHDDDEGTVFQPKTAASASPSGATSSGQVGEVGSSDNAGDGLSLRIGARIGEFEITGRVGEGGFSIVYLAMDHSLERTVALKEYLPASLAARAGTIHVQPRSQRHRETFEAGLKSFVNEAKLLAHFDHPSLVKVYRFWEANGTAYMVMPFYQGVTAKEAIRALPAPPDEAWLMALLGPLTEALMVLHSEYCYHRDVAPDNVLLLSGSGKPLLLDFGAARRVIGDMTQALTVILKAGYAPVEQYAEVPGMKQGPWTDVYALAAVVYWAITGSTPPASVGRMMSDSFVPLAERVAGRYSHRFLQAIDRALVVLPEKRTQTMQAFRQDIGLVGGSPSNSPAPMQWNDPDATVIRVPSSKSGVSPDANVGRMDSALHPTRSNLGLTTSGWPESSDLPDGPVGISQPSQSSADEAASSRVPPSAAETRSGYPRMVLAVSALGAAIAAIGIWWVLQQPSAESSRATVEGAKVIEPAPAPIVTPRAADSPGTVDAGGDPRTTAPAATESAPNLPPPAATETAKQVPATPPSPAETVPAAPSGPVTKQSTRPPPRTEEVKLQRRQSDSVNSEECNRILQRLSLGESSPELIERLKVLKCR